MVLKSKCLRSLFYLGKPRTVLPTELNEHTVV